MLQSLINNANTCTNGVGIQANYGHNNEGNHRSQSIHNYRFGSLEKTKQSPDSHPYHRIRCHKKSGIRIVRAVATSSFPRWREGNLYFGPGTLETQNVSHQTYTITGLLVTIFISESSQSVPGSLFNTPLWNTPGQNQYMLKLIIEGASYKDSFCHLVSKPGANTCAYLVRDCSYIGI